MNFLKRAAMSVLRRKGKTVILFVVFAVIANMVLTGLAIQHATQYASELARQKLGGQLTLKFNTQGALQRARDAGEKRPATEPVTEEMAKLVAGLEHIVGYNYIVNTNGLAEGFSAVVTDEAQEQDTANESPRPGEGKGSRNFVMPDVTVTGISAFDLIDAFKNGEAKMSEGRGITSEDYGKKVAMIEKNLADENELKVGDTITIKATRAEETVGYSIVGIYESSSVPSTSGQGMGNMAFTQPYNRIFVEYTSALPLKATTADSGIQAGGIDQVVFYVDDPTNIDKVKTSASALDIDWTKFVLDANDKAYQQMTKPIENVASFSLTTVYIVAIAGAAILSLILMLSMKERMYETGVLLAIGEGKSKIIAQYLVEVLVIALVAFSLSMFSGKYIAQGVSDALVQREIQAVEQQGSNVPAGNRGFGPFGAQNPENYQPIDSLVIRITAKEAEAMAGAGLLISIAGTILPAASVMRFKPKTILTKTT